MTENTTTFPNILPSGNLANTFPGQIENFLGDSLGSRARRWPARGKADQMEARRCSPHFHAAGRAVLRVLQSLRCILKSLPGHTYHLTPFHSSLGLGGLPDWELAVTTLVSTVPFLGMGSVLEEFRVGLTLAERLPLSKRLTSSNSVPERNLLVFHSAWDSFPSCSGEHSRHPEHWGG